MQSQLIADYMKELTPEVEARLTRIETLIELDQLLKNDKDIQSEEIGEAIEKREEIITSMGFNTTGLNAAKNALVVAYEELIQEVKKAKISSMSWS